jgi:hypothetical protein
MIVTTINGPGGVTQTAVAGNARAHNGIQCTAAGCVGTGPAQLALVLLQEQINRFSDSGNFVPLTLDGVITDLTTAIATRAAGVAMRILQGNASDELAALAAGHMNKAQIAQNAQTLSNNFTAAAEEHSGIYGRGSLGDYASNTDYKCNSEICYGVGAVHQQFVDLQKWINAFAASGGFASIKPDGFIGNDTVKAAPKAAIAISKLPAAPGKLPYAARAAIIRLLSGAMKKTDIAAQAQTLRDIFKEAATTRVGGVAANVPRPLAPTPASVPTTAPAQTYHPGIVPPKGFNPFAVGTAVQVAATGTFKCDARGCYNTNPANRVFQTLQQQINRFAGVGKFTQIPVDGVLGDTYTMPAAVRAARITLSMQPGIASSLLQQLSTGSWTKQQLAANAFQLVHDFRTAAEVLSNPAPIHVATGPVVAPPQVHPHPNVHPASTQPAPTWPQPVPQPVSQPAPQQNAPNTAPAPVPGLPEDYAFNKQFKCMQGHDGAWMCFGISAVHAEFVELQRQIARIVPTSMPTGIDGKIGDETLIAAIHAAQIVMSEHGHPREYPALRWLAGGHATLEQVAARAMKLANEFRAAADARRTGVARPGPVTPIPPPIAQPNQDQAEDQSGQSHTHGGHGHTHHHDDQADQVAAQQAAQAQAAQAQAAQAHAAEAQAAAQQAHAQQQAAADQQAAAQAATDASVGPGADPNAQVAPPANGPTDIAASAQALITSCATNASGADCKKGRAMCRAVKGTPAAEEPSMKQICATIGMEQPAWVWWVAGGVAGAALLFVGGYLIVRNRTASGPAYALPTYEDRSMTPRRATTHRAPSHRAATSKPRAKSKNGHRRAVSKRGNGKSVTVFAQNARR